MLVYRVFGCLWACFVLFSFVGCGSGRSASLLPVEFDVYVGFDGARTANLEKAEYKAQARYVGYVLPFAAPLQFEALLDRSGRCSVKTSESGVSIQGVIPVESRKVSYSLVRVKFSGEMPVQRIPAALFSAPVSVASTNLAISTNLKPGEIDALIENADAAVFSDAVGAALTAAGVKPGTRVTGSAWTPVIPAASSDGRSYSTSFQVKVVLDPVP